MSKEAMKLALEALKYIDQQDSDRDFLHYKECEKLSDAIESLEEALVSEQEQRSDRAIADSEQLGEPVAWWDGNSKFATPKAKDWDKRTGGTISLGCDIPLYTNFYTKHELLAENLPKSFVPLQTENGKLVYAACMDPEMRHYKWLMWKHPDGQWVSKRKLEPWEIMQIEDQRDYGIIQKADHGIKE
jgi:hypothetical protein